MRVAITGAGSYIGTHIAEYLLSFPDSFDVCELDTRKELTTQDLTGFDAVIHVAGIAHQKETPDSELMYMAVNSVLAVETARKAKLAGVRQFIFFSSMSVYGMTTGRIDAQTIPKPNTFYGKSKLAAERGLKNLADDSFRIATLRPPMIYGRGCPGNYPRLAALACTMPVFPKVSNQRSMLYIGTLCRLIQKLLESGEGGLYFPQNREYVNTSALVSAIASCHGKKLICLPGFSVPLHLLESKVGVVGKVFGSLVYDQAMSMDCRCDDEVSFEESIRLTEVGK